MNKDIVAKGTGIAVLQEGKVLLGLRQDGLGWGLAGGKIEEGETPEECAARELREEFGLKALALEPMGDVVALHNMGMVQSSIFLCNQYIGEVQLDIKEHGKYQWIDLKSALTIDHLFPPSREGIKLVLAYLKIGGGQA